MTAHPGPCLRIRAFDEPGDPQPGVLSAPTARRCEYLRDQWIGNRRHEVYRDRKSGEVYAMPTDDVYEETHIGSPKGKAPRGRAVSSKPTPRVKDRKELSLHLD